MIDVYFNDSACIHNQLKGRWYLKIKADLGVEWTITSGGNIGFERG